MAAATSPMVMTAAQGVAAGDQTGYSRITSETPCPLGYLSHFSLLHLHKIVEGLYFHCSLSVCLSVCLCVYVCVCMCVRLFSCEQNSS